MKRSSMAALTGVLACTAGGAGALAATTSSPKTVKGGVLTVRPGTLKPGSSVPASDVVSPRVFVNANDGFALVSAGQAQYAGATTDGGKTWKTDSPALHVDAAQAPLSVSELGATNAKTIYAYGSGQAVDVTTNGGKTWYIALFQGLVEAVVPGQGSHLVTYAQPNAGSAVQQYVSKNGGRTWTLTTALGGG